MTPLALSGVTGRKLRRVDLSFVPGVVHAVVGGPDEEARELVAICAGIVRPKRGTVLLDGNQPFRSPETRRRIGALLDVEELPAGPTVAISVARAFGIRDGAMSVRPAFSSFGLEWLLSRGATSLSQHETRCVALALALALEAPLLLVLHEPFAAGLPREDVRARLASRAADGAIVLAVMASAREAAESGASIVRLRSPRGLERPSEATAQESGVPS